MTADQFLSSLPSTRKDALEQIDGFLEALDQHRDNPEITAADRLRIVLARKMIAKSGKN